MKKDNLKDTKNIKLIIVFISLIIIFFSLLVAIKDNHLIKEIKDFVKADTKVLYITNKDNYSDYPIELFEKYEIIYLYVNSTKLSKIEKNKMEKIINSKYLSNIIVIFNNGEIVDAIIEYENEEKLNKFLQKNELIPEVIGDNSKIIDNVTELLETEYTLIYLPYKNMEDIEKQDKILKDISEDYEINYKKVDAYLLSKNQQNKLNTLLQISEVEDQIVILVRKEKIIGSIRGINNKKNYLTELKDFSFVEDVSYLITHINLDEFNKLLNNSEKNVIVIGKDDCKYCDEVIETLNDISINYDVKINYINIGEMNSEVSTEIQNKLNELEYNDGFTTPITLIVEDNKLLDYIIGASNEEYFIDIFTENGIIK